MVELYKLSLPSVVNFWREMLLNPLFPIILILSIKVSNFALTSGEVKCVPESIKVTISLKILKIDNLWPINGYLLKWGITRSSISYLLLIINSLDLSS